VVFLLGHHFSSLPVVNNLKCEHVSSRVRHFRWDVKQLDHYSIVMAIVLPQCSFRRYIDRNREWCDINYTGDSFKDAMSILITSTNDKQRSGIGKYHKMNIMLHIMTNT
jgi:hypothetical protein